MEGESKMDTSILDHKNWTPEAMFANCANKRGTGVTSTPNFYAWQTFTKNLEDSEESSKQDSGYSSLTPQSGDSIGNFSQRCHHCSRILHGGYAQSTPEYIMCCCRKPSNVDHPNNLECMQTIPEMKSSPTPKCFSRVRISRPIDFYSETMDTSLYTEEMEVDNISAENHHCSLEFSELGEEKSIDFVEPDLLNKSKTCEEISLISSSSAKDVIVIESKKRDRKDDELEEFFSPDSNFFSFNEESPKSLNELTPQKMKMSLSPSKLKKISKFQSSVKKVTTINRVIKSFSLNGIDHVDFFYQLGVKNSFPFIISNILSYLSEKDLESVRLVSKTWNKILFNDSPAHNRWQIFKTRTRIMKENLMSPTKENSQTRTTMSPLGPLLQMQNHMSPIRNRRTLEPYSPPVSPRSARFHSFRNAARLARQDERVLACPRCLFASIDVGDPYIQCSRSGCRHSFCVWCKNEAFPNSHHSCPPQYTPCSVNPRRSIYKVPSLGSKKAKKNLRRL